MQARGEAASVPSRFIAKHRETCACECTTSAPCLVLTSSQQPDVSDLASNVNRLVKIIQEVDIKVTDEQIMVVTLKFASAIDLAPQVTAAVEAKLGEAGGAAPGRPRAARGVARPGVPGAAAVSGPEKVFRVIADPRSNALVIVAARDEMAMALDLIAKLDVRLPPGRAQIHVYFLENALSEDLAKVLTAQAQELVRAVGQQPTPSARPPTVAAPAPPSPSPPPQTGPTSGVVPTAGALERRSPRVAF